MLHICESCNKIIEDFDHVRAEVEAVYHPLKSATIYALEKNTMQIVGKLKHANCHWPKGQPEE